MSYIASARRGHEDPMNLRMVTISAVTLLLGAALSAQAPSLAGTWNIDLEKTTK